jgi:hypothetical protein
MDFPEGSNVKAPTGIFDIRLEPLQNVIYLAVWQKMVFIREGENENHLLPDR